MKLLEDLLFSGALLASYIVLVDASFAMTAVMGGHSMTAVSSPRILPGIKCYCGSKVEPVCGSDKKTYSNICLLKCINEYNSRSGMPLIDIASYGECQPIICDCPTLYQPVCGSDNQTYSGKCEFECEKNRRLKFGLPIIHIVYNESCRQSVCECKKDINPVCGTDSKTYRNLCTIICLNYLNIEKRRPAIGVMSFGACPVENCLSPLIKKPICGTNMRTYDNSELLDCENRRRDQLGLPLIEILYGGNCMIPWYCMCSELFKPVCGSDNKTYTNFCILNCVNKRRVSYGLPPLLSTLGKCPCECKEE